jgi:uncharacterized protein YjbI with pentapeptide repeats
MPPTPDYYALLHVARTATAEELRTAYRKLAREHHPDANAAPEAATRMRELNQAWEVLRDPETRNAYDRTLPRMRVMVQRKPRAAAGPTVRSGPQAAGSWFKEDAPRVAARPSAEFSGDPSIDWYAELGVRRDAPRHEILKALSRMAASLDGADVSATEFARRRRAMRDGWAILGDPHLRAAYDRARNSAASVAGTQPPRAEAAPSGPPAGYRLGPVTVGNMTVDRGADLVEADLRGADLRGYDLAGIDLSRSLLQGADFEAASLRKAKLAGADLAGANLRWADLSNADCGAANLRQADLGGAALHSTNFFRAAMAGASFAGAVGPAINLDFADLARADFSGAKITAQLIERGRLAGTIMPDGMIRDS